MTHELEFVNYGVAFKTITFPNLYMKDSLLARVFL